MLISLKLTSKIWQAYVVTRRHWFDASVWQTKVSALKGWGWQWRRFGFRMVTPLLGFGVLLDLKPALTTEDIFAADE